MTKSSRKTNHEFLSVKPCGRDLYELIPKKNVRFEIDTIAKTLEREGFKIMDQSDLVIQVKKAHDISLYPSGKMLVFPASSGEEAVEIGQEIMILLRKSGNCIQENCQ